MFPFFIKKICDQDQKFYDPDSKKNPQEQLKEGWKLANNIIHRINYSSHKTITDWIHTKP